MGIFNLEDFCIGTFWVVSKMPVLVAKELLRCHFIGFCMMFRYIEVVQKPVVKSL